MSVWHSMPSYLVFISDLHKGNERGGDSFSLDAEYVQDQ